MTKKEELFQLRQLSKLFCDFKKQSSGPRPRIPETLRLRALASRRQGIRTSEISKACGISPYRLTIWDQQYSQSATESVEEIPATKAAPFPVRAPARILEVIENKSSYKGLEISVNDDGITLRFSVR